jgi:hypothetical protein
MTDPNEYQAFFLPYFLTNQQPDRVSPYLREILAEEDLQHRYSSPFLDGTLAFGPSKLFLPKVSRIQKVKRKRGNRSKTKVQRRKFWKQIYRNIHDTTEVLDPQLPRIRYHLT